MTKNLLRHYFFIIGIIFFCVLFTGLVLIFQSYLSLKDTVLHNSENSAKLILDDFENEVNKNNELNGSMLEIYSKNLNMDIYIYDKHGDLIISNSCNKEYYQHSDWKFGDAIQYDINPVTNVSYMEKFEVEFEPFEVYVACVMPYGIISEHTDKTVNILLLLLLVLTAGFSVTLCIYNYHKYKYVLQIEKNCGSGYVGEYAEIALPKKVLPQYEPLLKAIRALQERLNYSDKHMVEFVSNISHELKTPLTVIKGFLGAVLDGTIDAEHRYKYLVKVLNETNRMQQIIKNMLNTSNIEAGKITLKIEQFNIIEVLAEIIFMFEKRIEEKHINIISISYPEILVSGDRILLHQVFYNLFENAVKFVDYNGMITIAIDYCDGNIHFFINNSGSGIPKKDLAHVFDRFFKSDYSRSDNPDGVGLGLSIVRKFVNQHHGNITISSEEGRFTEFMLTFPRDFIAE